MKIIITNADLDALVSSLFLIEQLEINEPDVSFIEPYEAQNKELVVNNDSVLANIPYIPQATLWFDHHKSNIDNHQEISGLRKIAPSCAQVIADYYEIKSHDYLLQETNRIDSGELNAGDIASPDGYMLFSNVIGSDTHNKQEMDFNRRLIKLLQKDNVDDILKDNSVHKKVQSYLSNLEDVREYMSQRLTLNNNVVIIDMRDAQDRVYIDSAFKFMQYVLCEKSNVSIRIYHPNLNKTKTRFQVGWSVLNKTCKTDISALLSPLKGGGHRYAGGVTVPTEKAQKTYQTILDGLVE